VGRTGKIVTQCFTGPDLQDCDTKNAFAQGCKTLMMLSNEAASCRPAVPGHCNFRFSAGGADDGSVIIFINKNI
jgi:hypothetical protein